MEESEFCEKKSKDSDKSEKNIETVIPLRPVDRSFARRGKVSFSSFSNKHGGGGGTVTWVGDTEGEGATWGDTAGRPSHRSGSVPILAWNSTLSHRKRAKKHPDEIFV